MKWREIRAQYAACYAELQEKTGATQTSVAAAGGVAQNAVSKLLGNHKRGPSVETFVGAVEGLGLSLSAFFAALEAPGPVAVEPTDYARVVDRLVGLEGVVHALVAALSSSSVNSDGAADQAGARGRHEHIAIRSGSLELGAIEALLGAARAVAASRESLDRAGGSVRVARRRGGAGAARGAGRHQGFKETA
jgi:transcriptional regulator with XRE-family HTH domain